MSAAREEVLSRIRKALGYVPSEEQPEDVRVERSYRHTDELPRAELVERFAERVSEYRATVRRVCEDELRGAILDACQAHGVSLLAVPRDLPTEWLPEGLEVLRDEGLTAEELDSVDGVLTGCALAVAQTGTIALDGGSYQGRRMLTLVPDYHLCVLREDQVVGIVPEAISRLRGAVSDEGRPVTLISGPSATSDIELNRVEGVHGPRTLEILIVGGDE